MVCIGVLRERSVSVHSTHREERATGAVADSTNDLTLT